MLHRRGLIRGATIAVGAGLACPASAQNKGSVSGRVVDENGSPLAGVNVEAVYQTVSAPRLPYGGQSIKATGTSGADGRYSLSLAQLPPGEYSAHAYQVVVNGERRLNFNLVAVDPRTFGSHQAATRDFRRVMVESSPEMPYGNAGIFVLENALMDYTDLASAEVTLAPQAGGPAIVRRVRRTGEGLVVSGIAYGTYRASVRLGGKPLQLQLWGSDSDSGFAESIVHDFTMGYLGNQFRVFAKVP